MSALFESTVFWIGLFAFVLAALGIINYFMSRVSKSCCDQANYPHRVANELPRVLHTKDGDEVLELKDETELQAK